MAGRRYTSSGRPICSTRPASITTTAIGQDEGLRLIVGHEDHRRTQTLLKALQLHAHLVAQERVEVRERLVEEQHAGLEDERPGQRHALLLTAGELARVPSSERAEPHQLEHPLDARPQLGRAHPAPAKTEGDVLEHGHVREQRVRLEDQPEIAAMHGHPRDVLAREDHLPAVGLDEPSHRSQERALATARGTEEETNSPGATSRLTSSTATTGPNDLRSLRTLSAGVNILPGGPEMAPRPQRSDAPRRSRGAPRRQRAISRPQRSDHSGNFFATRSVSGKNMRCTIGP